MIQVPGDKSISHRALLFAGLAEGESRLRGLLTGADCQSTASVLRSLGVSVPVLPLDGSELRILGRGPGALRSAEAPLDCGNSGTTARLLLGLLAGLPIEASLTGDASLRSRPMRRVTGPLAEMGAQIQEEGVPDRLPLRIQGGALHSIHHRSPVASAQVKSAILLAGLTGRVPVRVTEPHPSRDHSERMLRRIGVEVLEESGPDGWTISLPHPPASLRPLDLLVPGDFSSAAFVMAFALLGGAGGKEVRLTNVGLNPTRTGLLDLLREMGAEIRVEHLRESEDLAGEPAADLVVFPSELHGTSVGGAQIPLLIDEVPILAVIAARAQGVTEIRDAGELRVKESDRIRVLVENLSALGARVEELEDGLRITGGGGELRGSIAVHHDHRIAMAFGVLGALPGNQVQIDDPTAADVSFPGFWSLLDQLASGEEGAG